MILNKADPLKTKNIRKVALNLRRFFKIKDSSDVDIVKIYDRLCLCTFGGIRFSYNIVSDDCPILDPFEEARTVINTGEIIIKESVWNAACNLKNSRALFTLAHELGHFIIAVVFEVSLYRVSKKSKIKPFEDPEWQADTFASEFLMPFDECIGKSAQQISKQFNVSMSCAKTRERKVNNELKNKLFENKK